MDYVNEIYNLLKDEINTDKYNEIIYEYCIKVKWKEPEIEELGNLINKNVKKVRELAANYFKKISFERQDDNPQYLNIQVIEHDYYQNAYSICYAYNFNEEEIKNRFPYIRKELYYNSTVVSELIEVGKEYKSILDKFKVKNYEEYKKVKKELEYNQEEYLEIPNSVLLKYGIRSYRIGRTKEEREITIKYIYEKFIENEGIIGSLLNEFKLTPKQIEKYVKEYYTKNQNQESTRFNKKKAIYSYVLDKLQKLNTDSEIISLLDSSGMKINYLKRCINPYIIIYNEPNTFEEYKKEEVMFLKKLDIYSNYLSQRKKEQQKKIKEEEKQKNEDENLEEATKYISMFIETKEFHSIKSFFDFIKIDIKTFNNYVNIIKNRNQELYEKYKEKIENNMKQNFAINASIVKKIILMLKNGIEENGALRKFDILDYYQNTKLSFDNFTKIAVQICSKQELNLLKKFIKDNSKYTIDTTHIEETIMKEKVEINYQLDKNGMPIPGTGEIFDDESKIKIINYLKRNKIPLNMKTYNLARRRYINGILDIKSKNKAKVLTKKNNEGENNE